MKRSWLLAGLLAAGTLASSAGAQIIDSGRNPRGFVGRPKAWGSLFAGWAQHQYLCEPGACWDFGDALQWRGTLEYPIGTGTGTTIGIVATHAKMPLLYEDTDLGGSVDADANVSQLLGQLRIGGGSGIHTVYDITAGMAFYSNFRRTSDGAQITPTTSRNWTFAIAPGLALPLSPRFQVVLLQEWGVVIGKRVPNESRNTAQTQTFRIGARLGLGG